MLSKACRVVSCALWMSAAKGTSGSIRKRLTSVAFSQHFKKEFRGCRSNTRGRELKVERLLRPAVRPRFTAHLFFAASSTWADGHAPLHFPESILSQPCQHSLVSSLRLYSMTHWFRPRVRGDKYKNQAFWQLLVPPGLRWMGTRLWNVLLYSEGFLSMDTDYFRKVLRNNIGPATFQEVRSALTYPDKLLRINRKAIDIFIL